MMELCQQVTKETSPVEHDIPFSEHIMEEELRVHFRAPPHLPASDGNTDPSEHIRKFESTTLLHRISFQFLADSNKLRHQVAHVYIVAPPTRYI
ncbi:UNVERIFIED_CONTAM: hypothetical protein Sindi_2252600 [Sesamum indicum]